MPGAGIAERFHTLSTAAWLYPLKGIGYVLVHPYLYPLFRARFLPCLLLSTFVLAVLFIWTYIPQVLFLAIFHGKGAWLNGTFLVLEEGAVIIAVLFEAFLVDETQVDIFDAVLVAHGLEDLVKNFRPVESPETGLNPVKRLGKPVHSSQYAPFSFRQIFEFIILLPLNFIPWVGWLMFLVLTGYRAGPLHHFRYFKLRVLEKKEKKAWIKRRKGRYTLFGAMALSLQLVPVLDMLFIMTNAAGSALWVVELESQRTLLEGSRADGQEYTDNPV